MKKIGILYGRESGFPEAFIERVNARGGGELRAEAVRIDKVIQGEPADYAVIVDRISQDVPFYRAYLKNAALSGTAVINNPFWWSADEKFFNNSLATRIGVPVPKTVLLPSRDLPEGTSEESFRNLAYPLDWDHIFQYVGFPAYLKPFSGGGWKHVFRVEDPEAFFERHARTGQLVMMLQEEIVFDQYFRCYAIGAEHIRIMGYDPTSPHHLRYSSGATTDARLAALMGDYARRLNQFLGYDFNTVEFAVRDGAPYAIDFCNPAPDADPDSVGEENFHWVVETAADYAIRRAMTQQEGADNLTWGLYLERAARQQRFGRWIAPPVGIPS